MSLIEAMTQAIERGDEDDKILGTYLLGLLRADEDERYDAVRAPHHEYTSYEGDAKIYTLGGDLQRALAQTW